MVIENAGLFYAGKCLTLKMREQKLEMASSIPIEDLETGHEGFLSISLFRKLTTKMFCKKKPEVFWVSQIEKRIFSVRGSKKIDERKSKQFFPQKSVGKQSNMRR